MPIEGVSNIVRIPRLGKIKLGRKVEPPGRSPYPQATDHFVCPPEVQAAFGEKPTEIEIMFPSEDTEIFCQQYLRSYSLSQGLVCIGDGVRARAKVDRRSGEIASHETQDWEWKEDQICNPQECPHYLARRCRRVMNLQFLIPKVEGLGVCQIDTSSFYSIVNINSMIELVRNLCGRISFLPLTLCLGPIEVTPPGMKKKTVHVMHIKQEIKLAQLLEASQQRPARLLLPKPDVEEPPDDLFPPEVIDGSYAAEKSEREVSMGCVVVPPTTAPAPVPAVVSTADESDDSTEGDTGPEDFLGAWRDVVDLIKELNPDESRLKDWWLTAHKIVVSKSDFTRHPKYPPQKFSGAAIIDFRNKLKETKEAVKQQADQQPLWGAG